LAPTGFWNAIHRLSLQIILSFHLAQIIFGAALAGVVATQLDYQPKSPYCYLNVKGQVCVFTYITAGAIMLFTLLTILPVAYFYKQGRSLYAVYLHLTLFSFFWQLVCALTITIRGNQAQDSGVPKESSRQSAYAFAWLGVSLTFISSFVILGDIIREYKAESREAKKLKATLKMKKSIHVDSVSFLNRGVGVAY